VRHITCSDQLPAASLLPFLAAGFDLEVFAYPGEIARITSRDRSVNSRP
jgi:hypothetical protein